METLKQPLMAIYVVERGDPRVKIWQRKSESRRSLLANRGVLVFHPTSPLIFESIDVKTVCSAHANAELYPGYYKYIAIRYLHLRAMMQILQETKSRPRRAGHNFKSEHLNNDNQDNVIRSYVSDDLPI